MERGFVGLGVGIGVVGKGVVGKCVVVGVGVGAGGSKEKRTVCPPLLEQEPSDHDAAKLFHCEPSAELGPQSRGKPMQLSS